MKSFFIFFLSFCFTVILAEPVNLLIECSAPQNVAATSINAGNISFDWDDCSGGCTEYKVKYHREEDSYSSSEFTTSSSAFSFSNLPDGTYDFYFSTVCGGDASSLIIIEEIVID
ncbi:MAG: fibronectin type III domain-containing protein [Bacteroidota bacterium]